MVADLLFGLVGALTKLSVTNGAFVVAFFVMDGVAVLVADCGKRGSAI